MKWAKHHQELLGFSLGFILVIVSLWSRIVRADKYATNLVEQYLNPEHVVVKEQEIQNKPIEPHTIGEQKIPIMVYHSVRPYRFGESQLQNAYDITPELFEKQLIYLRDNGYHVIVPNDLFVDEKTGKVMTNVSSPVMLTFDDGWRNQYEYAFPLLKKYNMRAVFYVYTSPIGSPSFLSWENLKEMHDSGMILGGHTVTHPFLKKLSDEKLHNEVFKGKEIIEKKLGISIDDFATPYGYSDDRIVSVVKEAGYKTSRTLYKGSYHNDLFNLKGYLVRDNFDDFVYILKKGD